MMNKILMAVVKKILEFWLFVILRMLSSTSGRLGPGFGENFASNVSAKILAFSTAVLVYVGPLGPTSG